MRILICEDDRTCATLLAALLKPYGDCEVAADGEDAIRRYAQAWGSGQAFGLVTLDIFMPTIDGQTVLRVLRAFEAGLDPSGKQRAHIIMSTTMKGAGVVMESFRNQCEGYLNKPIAPDKLRELLAQLKLQPRSGSK